MPASVIGRPSDAALQVAGLTVDEQRDVVYGQTPEQTLTLDLCRPLGAPGRRPGVVLVHGGGWTAGKREQFSRHARELAERGYVAITISYRLAGLARYPAAVDDCQRAVRWLRSQAGALSVDPDRIGAVGSSAGAHLAACLGVRDTRTDDDPALTGLSSRANVVVDVHGIHDFAALPEPCRSGLSVPFLGRPLAEAPRIWADASPITHVDERAAPMLIVHDPMDPTVPCDQSVRFAAALMAAGTPVEFMPVPGAGHGFVYNLDGAWAQRVWPRAVAWLDRWLGDGA